jgi:hypothetical protein
MKAIAWPNGLGFDVTAGPVKYEVWPSGSVVRLRKDDSPTGYRGAAYVEVHNVVPKTPESVMALVGTLADHPDVWTPCFD